jgi:hypothetical protein
MLYHYATMDKLTQIELKRTNVTIDIVKTSSRYEENIRSFFASQKKIVISIEPQHCIEATFFLCTIRSK